MRGAQMYVLSWVIESNSLHPDLGAEFDSVCEKLMKTILNCSSTAFQAFVICVLYVLKQRVLLFRSVLVNFKPVGTRNEAWTVKRRIKAAERRRYIRRLRFLYNVLLNLYIDVKQFSKHYFCFNFLLIVFLITFDLLMSVSAERPVSLAMLVVNIVSYLSLIHI